MFDVFWCFGLTGVLLSEGILYWPFADLALRCAGVVIAACGIRLMVRVAHRTLLAGLFVCAGVQRCRRGVALVLFVGYIHAEPQHFALLV